jgi:ABC-type lipoprotein release transport system permease subunit
MAWRNLWRNRRRTLVTLSSIAFGVMFAVLFTGLGDKTYGDMIDLAARMGGGHVTLQHPEYLDTPSLKRTVADAESLREIARQHPHVVRTASRIGGHAMLATAGNSYGAFFIAFDPEQEDEQTLSVLEAITEGEMFSESEDKGIVLGARLAENLKTKLGRKVVYTMTDKQGEIVSGLARVKGIVETGSPSLDGGVALLPLDTMREFLGYEPHEATQVAVFIDDQRRADDVAAQLGASVGDRADAVPWHRAQPELAGFIEMKVAGTTFFEIIIAVIVAAGIFNTLFVSVMERLREFGIMMAIGFSPGRLFRLVMWESLWLGLVGLVEAGIVTAWPYYHLNTSGIDFSAMVGEGGSEVAGVAIEPIMYVGIFPEHAVAIALAALAATLFSGLYPAWRAGRVVPVESIKLV